MSVLTCYPEQFTEAEEKYLTYEYVDDLVWNLYSHESKVIRESDIVDDEHRFNTPMYKACYKKYNIYDNLLITIRFNNKLYGVLTLFSTSSQGVYSSEDMFFLRSIGMHINTVISRLYENFYNSSNSTAPNLPDINDIMATYQFTPRETDIIKHLLTFEEISEISDALGISEHTL